MRIYISEIRLMMWIYQNVDKNTIFSFTKKINYTINISILHQEGLKNCLQEICIRNELLI